MAGSQPAIPFFGDIPMSNRPDFLTTKGERNIKSNQINVSDIEMHYRDILRGLFVWHGLPDDMPTGFIDADALYVAKGFALKNVKALGLCGFPCNPVTVDIYGQPATWLAQPYGWASETTKATASIDSDIFKDSDTPVLWNRASIRDRILPYIQIMSRALQCLGTNISALSHPVLISGMASGNAGDNIGSILLKNELEEGSTYIPVVAPSALGLDAIDLHATDNTQNLISVVDWCDARILEIIGASVGVEKSSGITTAETASGKGGLGAMSDSALALRSEWAMKVNSALGTDITVERNNVIENVINGVDDDGNVPDTGSESDSDTEDKENRYR